MLQIIYLIAFTILAFLAIGNLIRSLIGFSMDASQPRSMVNPNLRNYGYRNGTVPHPELLDDMGNVTNEPLLIMKSMTPYGLIDPYRRSGLVFEQGRTFKHFHGHARTITRRGVARPSFPSSMKRSTSSPSVA